MTNEIKNRMKRVKIDMELYDVVSMPDECYRVQVKEIINEKEGILKVYESGINQYRNMSILALCFYDEKYKFGF